MPDVRSRFGVLLGTVPYAIRNREDRIELPVFVGAGSACDVDVRGDFVGGSQFSMARSDLRVTLTYSANKREFRIIERSTRNMDNSLVQSRYIEADNLHDASMIVGFRIHEAFDLSRYLGAHPQEATPRGRQEVTAAVPPPPPRPVPRASVLKEPEPYAPVRRRNINVK